MDRKELLRDYWSYYLTLEDKFMRTFQYVSLDSGNFGAFSNEYALLIQATGSALDNFFKVYCGFQTNDRKTITDYAADILSRYPDIVTQKIKAGYLDNEIIPFKDWDLQKPAKSLAWWQTYDDIKHDYVANKSNANLENALNILAALFLLEMKMLNEITSKTGEKDIPDMMSCLFVLDWEYRYIPFAGMCAEYIKDK